MSLFDTFETDCPNCGVVAEYDVVESVNADRRPELRDEILDGSFQVLTCEACGEHFTVEPEFTYIHMAANQFLTVWPSSRIDDWAALEKRSDAMFDAYYGPGTTPAAAQIGKTLVKRTVFGWQAVREKIAAAAAGLDDVTLELAKIAMMRWSDSTSPDDETELRFIGPADDDTIVFAEFTLGSEEMVEQVSVARSLLSEIEADAESWQTLRERLTGGSFVDVLRLQLEPAQAD